MYTFSLNSPNILLCLVEVFSWKAHTEIIYMNMYMGTKDLRVGVDYHLLIFSDVGCRVLALANIVNAVYVYLYICYVSSKKKS